MKASTRNIQALGEGWRSAAIRELDCRVNDGIEVRLLWNETTNEVFVSIEGIGGVGFAFLVPPADALKAFHHPYVYAHADDGRLSRPEDRVHC